MTVPPSLQLQLEMLHVLMTIPTLPSIATQVDQSIDSLKKDTKICFRSYRKTGPLEWLDQFIT